MTTVTSVAGRGTVVTLVVVVVVVTGNGKVTEGIGVVTITGVTEIVFVHVVAAVVASTGIS